MVTIPMKVSKNFHILNSTKSTAGRKQTIMISIDAKEEESIDNIGNKVLSFTRGDRTFSVKVNDIYCYGEVDLHDKNTCDTISGFKFLDYLGAIGIHVFSNYDYGTHTCSSPKKFPLYTETWNPLYLVKFAHAALNKPKRILLFNQFVK